MRKPNASIGEKIMLTIASLTVVLLVADSVAMMSVHERWDFLRLVINTVLFTVIWCSKDSLKNPNRISHGENS